MQGVIGGRLILFFLFILCLLNTSQSEHWDTKVSGKSFSWEISRDIINMSLDLSSSVNGNISPVEYHGKHLYPYQSLYTEIVNNDVRLSQRTAAWVGTINSEESIKLNSSNDRPIYISVVKPRGTSIFLIQMNETWPTLLISDKKIQYSGKMINDRDYGLNNGNYVASGSLYNNKFINDRRLVLFTERMNATVKATNQSLIEALVEPTGMLAYNGYYSTTGIQDWSYRLSGSKYGGVRGYPSLSGADDRYYGNFNISRKLFIKNNYDRIFNQVDPIGSCCVT